MLLDTHAFLWWALDDPRLTPNAREVISDGANAVYVSAVTAYELTLKANVGRISLPDEPSRYVARRIESLGFDPLSVTVGHAARAASLPPVHRDPWDRILVAQAQDERMPIVSADEMIRRYDVETIW